MATHCITTNNKPMIGKVKIRCLFLLAWLAALSTKAQVSSENYILTTERISDTQVLSTTEYYDGLGNGNEIYEFKNIAGNVILKRTICSIDEAADTYYIYNYRGNLAFVLPPNYQEEP